MGVVRVRQAAARRSRGPHRLRDRTHGACHDAEYCSRSLGLGRPQSLLAASQSHDLGVPPALVLLALRASVLVHLVRAVPLFRFVLRIQPRAARLNDPLASAPRPVSAVQLDAPLPNAGVEESDAHVAVLVRLLARRSGSVDHVEGGGTPPPIPLCLSAAWLQLVG